jgi:hypothetical protein
MDDENFEHNFSKYVVFHLDVLSDFTNVLKGEDLDLCPLSPTSELTTRIHEVDR